MSFLKNAKRQVAHTTTVPSLGSSENKALQHVITAEKSYMTANARCAAEAKKASDALKAWGEEEGEDLGDVMSKLSQMLDHHSSALNRFSSHLAQLRLHFKAVRTRAEGLSELKKRKASLASRIESVEKKLSKMGPENKELPNTTRKLEDMQNEMQALHRDVLEEEAKLGDFKRRTAKEALGLKAGGLLEMAEKTTVIAELSKLVLEEIPLAPTLPGHLRRPYEGAARTDALLAEATRCVADVTFTPVANTDFGVDSTGGGELSPGVFGHHQQHSTVSVPGSLPLGTQHSQHWAESTVGTSRAGAGYDMDGSGAVGTPGDEWGRSVTGAVDEAGVAAGRRVDAEGQGSPNIGASADVPVDAQSVVQAEAAGSQPLHPSGAGAGGFGSGSLGIDYSSPDGAGAGGGDGERRGPDGLPDHEQDEPVPAYSQHPPPTSYNAPDPEDDTSSDLAYRNSSDTAIVRGATYFATPPVLPPPLNTATAHAFVTGGTGGESSQPGSPGGRSVRAAAAPPSPRAPPAISQGAGGYEPHTEGRKISAAAFRRAAFARSPNASAVNMNAPSGGGDVDGPGAISSSPGSVGGGGDGADPDGPATRPLQIHKRPANLYPGAPPAALQPGGAYEVERSLGTAGTAGSPGDHPSPYVDPYYYTVESPQQPWLQGHGGPGSRPSSPGGPYMPAPSSQQQQQQQQQQHAMGGPGPGYGGGRYATNLE